MSNNDRFHFPRKQRAGIIILVLIIVVGVLSWRIWKASKPPAALAGTNELQQSWVNFKKEQGPASREYDDNAIDVPDKNYAGVQTVKQLFPFDPNTASEEKLLSLGLPIRTAKTLIKYRSKGGRFYKKEDLLKLYNLSKEDYNRLEKYINIPGRVYIANAGKSIITSGKAPDIIDLNHADAATLMLLKGIGPAYAKRILEYRERLGGFIKIEQLAEVYGLPDSTYQQLKSRFLISSADIHKIDINSAGEEQLTAHPYIRKYMAANIIKLRNDLKKFTKIEELRQVPLINEEKYRKIAPYLSVN